MATTASRWRLRSRRNAPTTKCALATWRMSRPHSRHSTVWLGQRASPCATAERQRTLFNPVAWFGSTSEVELDRYHHAADRRMAVDDGRLEPPAANRIECGLVERARLAALHDAGRSRYAVRPDVHPHQHGPGLASARGFRRIARCGR